MKNEDSYSPTQTKEMLVAMRDLAAMVMALKLSYLNPGLKDGRMRKMAQIGADALTKYREVVAEEFYGLFDNPDAGINLNELEQMINELR